MAVVNTKTSNISSISDEDYLDEIFTELIEHYDLDVDNAAIYYLFDRDPRSNNSVPLIIGLMEKLKNSRENDDGGRGGMLILSYPSIEAYEISNFVERSFEVRASLGKELKKIINEKARSIALNKISGDSIIHAGREMVGFLDEQQISLDLDDVSYTNKAVFEKEEMELKTEGTYRLLSMFSCILMDLGLLTEF